MPSEPTYTQDYRAGFLSAEYPQMLDRSGATGGRIDTWGTRVAWFKNSYCTWGPFRSNNGYGYGVGNDSQRFTFYNSGSANKGNEGFPFNIDYIIEADGSTDDYYISWGRNLTGASPGFDSSTKNILPVDDDQIATTIVGTVVTFDNAATVTLTSASVRGSPSALGDYIGTFSTGTEPTYVAAITPA